MRCLIDSIKATFSVLIKGSDYKFGCVQSSLISLHVQKFFQSYNHKYSLDYCDKKACETTVDLDF